MNTLTITISWEWALGIIGLLIVIAWKGSARFSVIETSIVWMKEAINDLKETMNDLKVNADNRASGTPAFEAASPINLTALGKQWLEESGLQAYMEAHPQQFLDACSEKSNANPYEVQKHAFDLLDTVQIEHAVEEKLKRFAFEKGVSLEILRRIGGIHLRNLFLERFQMNAQDIDTHDPAQGQ
jgi:hypothetical protein